MTDIVERLRQGVDPGDITETEFAMDTGADEIERLRAECGDIVERLLLTPHVGALEEEAAAEIMRLKAEVETGARWRRESEQELRAEIERLQALGRETLSALETLGEDGWSEAPYLLKSWRRALEEKT